MNSLAVALKIFWNAKLYSGLSKSKAWSRLKCQGLRSTPQPTFYWRETRIRWEERQRSRFGKLTASVISSLLSMTIWRTGQTPCNLEKATRCLALFMSPPTFGLVAALTTFSKIPKQASFTSLTTERGSRSRLARFFRAQAILLGCAAQDWLQAPNGYVCLDRSQ